MAAPHANCFLPATERAERSHVSEIYSVGTTRLPPPGSPSTRQRDEKNSIVGAQTPQPVRSRPERFRCATIALANLGRATGRFVRRPTAPRPLVFLLGSVLKAGCVTPAWT